MTRDLRAYRRQTTRRLLLGFLILLFVVGDGLIYWFYGPEAALSGLVCLGAGLLPLIIIWAALNLLEWFVRSAKNRE